MERLLKVEVDGSVFWTPAMEMEEVVACFGPPDKVTEFEANVAKDAVNVSFTYAIRMLQNGEHDGWSMSRGRVVDGETVEIAFKIDKDDPSNLLALQGELTVEDILAEDWFLCPF